MSAGQPANDPERLPWLEPYRDPNAKRPKSKPAAPKTPKPQTKRSPFLALLTGGALLVALVGWGSYWFGRNSAPPVAAPAARGPSVTIPVAQVEPIPMPEAVAPEPAVAVPTLTVKPERRSVRRPARAAPTRVAIRAPARMRATAPPPAPPAPPPPKPRVPLRMSPPPVVAPAGQVIDLGRFVTARHADAAYRRLVARYPYLRQLPKVVAPSGGTYSLQLGARSRSDARALCRNIVKLGRPCAVR